ncbi:hypothetical protein KBB68_01315 [Candidatus Babeliales bacterium]|nr:hypothetical protein [Candidatus Babeliales bacterium]
MKISKQIMLSAFCLMISNAIYNSELMEMQSFVKRQPVKQIKPMTVHELTAEIKKIQADNLKVISQLYDYSIEHPNGPVTQMYMPGSAQAKQQNKENQQFHIKLLKTLMTMENQINQQLNMQLHHAKFGQIFAE